MFEDLTEGLSGIGAAAGQAVQQAQQAAQEATQQAAAAAQGAIAEAQTAVSNATTAAAGAANGAVAQAQKAAQNAAAKAGAAAQGALGQAKSAMGAAQDGLNQVQDTLAQANQMLEQVQQLPPNPAQALLAQAKSAVNDAKKQAQSVAEGALEALEIGRIGQGGGLSGLAVRQHMDKGPLTVIGQERRWSLRREAFDGALRREPLGVHPADEGALAVVVRDDVRRLARQSPLGTGAEPGEEDASGRAEGDALALDFARLDWRPVQQRDAACLCRLDQRRDEIGRAHDRTEERHSQRFRVQPHAAETVLRDVNGANRRDRQQPGEPQPLELAPGAQRQRQHPSIVGEPRARAGVEHHGVSAEFMQPQGERQPDGAGADDGHVMIG